MEYVLETNALTKHYRGSIALDGLTMCIPQGAMYGFVGRNGAGKTTLIRLICGLQAPTGGSYTLYGAKYPDPSLARARRRMGAVVETPSIYLGMTAAENLRQQYRVLGLPSEGSISDLLRLVGLEGPGKQDQCPAAGPPAFPAISLDGIIQRASTCTRNCISYSCTPNTGCPVLGVHSKPARLLFVFFISYPRFSSDDGVYASDDPARHVNASRASTQECSPSPHPIRARQTPF